MDKKKSVLNVTVSIVSKLVIMVVSIWVKRSLIMFCGNDVNGLNSLYLSIIGFLAVAELGVGSAISFCMYRPIVEGDNHKVSALYQLFRKWYLCVGAVILGCGLALTPFVHLFAKDYAQLNVDIYTPFVLMLVSVAVTYLFGAKTALIDAYKNNYITTAINSGGMLLQYVLQILVLYVTGSFSAYLVCRIMAALAQWCITEWITRKKYTGIISVSATIDVETKQELSQKIRAMFMHNIGLLLVNTVDSVVISIFIGVATLGAYSNYAAIQTSMDSLLRLVFTSLTAIIGHMYVEKTRETAQRYHEAFHLLNFVLGTLFYLGYYAVIDDLVAIIFNEKFVMARSVSMMITMNGFVQFLRRGTLTFRDATGTFYNDRWKPLLEGIVNCILSVVLVQRIGIEGVIIATIATNLLICHVVEPYVLYKNAFQESPGRYYLRNYGMILIFWCALRLFQVIEVSDYGHWCDFLINGTVSVVISVVVCSVTLLLNRDVRNLLRRRMKHGTVG